MIFFHYLIARSDGGEVTFTVPTRVAQLKTMIDPGGHRPDSNPSSSHHP
jgi:hypothetical protein